MKTIITLFSTLLLMNSFSYASTGGKKQICGLKAEVHVVDGKYVLVPENFRDHKLIPVGLPAEYKSEGLTVSIDGAVGKCHNKTIDLDIHRISIDNIVQKRLGLKANEYNNQATIASPLIKY